MKRNAVLAVIVMAVILCAGWSCNSDQRAQVAQAAQDASTVVKGFQQAEILAHQQGTIPDDDHAFIQQSLITVATMGKNLDGCIKSTGSNSGVVSCVNSAVTTIDQLNSEGALHLKSDKARVDFQLAMIGTRTALNVIATILGGNNAGK